MIRAQFTLRLMCLVTLLFLTVSARPAEATNTFSGRIVDVKGHPVSGLTLITRPTKLINGHAINAVGDVPIPSSEFEKSDDAGFFIITNVTPGPVQLELRPPMPEESWKSYEILSMKIGPTTFYPTAPSHRKGVKFAIEPDATLEDVVVTVRPRTRYRGQVVLKDGTPLGDTMVSVDEQSKYKIGNNPVSTNVAYPERTDANGYFIRYVDEPEFKVAIYTVQVGCQGLSDTAEFTLDSGEQKENLVFTLQGTPMSMRGRIVFEDGTPLPNAIFVLDVRGDALDNEAPFRFSSQPVTDNDGYFITYVNQPGAYIASVEYQGLSATSELVLKAGEQPENLVFTLGGVPMSIRGQIVFDDGTPLPETRFTLNVKVTGADEGHRSHLSGQRETDNAGFFVEYLYQPGFYTIAVEYQGLSATSELTLKFGEQRDDLVFTLNGAPVFFDIVGLEMMAPTVPNMIGVWIGAPNGSQYKSVRCSSWKDAQTKAHTEGAKLVSINNKAEQEWIIEHFGFLSYWIGLNYSVEEDEWEWSSGEPVTYTNWANGQPERMDAESYGFMDGGYHGEWRVVLRGDEILEWRTPIAAILEKK